MAYPKKNPLSLQLDLSKFQDVSEGEKAAQNIMGKSSTFFKDGCKRFVHNPIAMVSLFFIVIIVLAVIFIPIFWPYTYDEQLGLTHPLANGATDGSFIYLSPMTYSTTEQARIAAGEYIFPHLLGTDGQGRDYFIRVIYGTRISLSVGFFAAIIVLIIGSIYGAVSAYFGGKVDLVMMRIVDVIYSLPDLLMIILFSSVLSVLLGKTDSVFITKLGTGMISIFIVFGLLYWVGMARLVRGQILSIKKEDYVMAAKASGASGWWVITKHLLPNSISVIIISVALQIPSAIFTESFLSFLGLGVNAPMTSLGLLASEAQEVFIVYPYQLIVPAIMICIIVLALNLLGDGLRDSFDPKLVR